MLKGGVFLVFFSNFALQGLPEGTQLEQPWIAEMYGIALAAAQLGIRHSSHAAVVAPSDRPRDMLNKEGMPCRGSCISHVLHKPALHCIAHMLLGT